MPIAELRSHRETVPPSSMVEELRPTDLTPARTVGQWLSLVAALGALVCVDVMMRLAGFQRFHRLVRKWPTLGRRPPDASRVERICTAVDRAAVFYIKKAWCLQRSATAVCLLRTFGAPAELVIGVQKIPFYAHAWAEIGGTVVNDHPIVQRRYTVIERC